MKKPLYQLDFALRYTKMGAGAGMEVGAKMEAGAGMGAGAKMEAGAGMGAGAGMEVGVGAGVLVTDFESLLAQAVKILCGKKHLKHKMRGGTVQLALVEDRDIALLNAAYRNKDEPTDVISLSYFEEAGFAARTRLENLVGEIMISVDTAKKQARARQKTLKAELQFLFVHGLLHIFGYDHERASERKVMFDLQDEILHTKRRTKSGK